VWGLSSPHTHCGDLVLVVVDHPQTLGQIFKNESEVNSMIDFTAINTLRKKTGCSSSDCAKAVKYDPDDEKMQLAYLKAKTIAVATPGMTFDERVRHFYET
jgi:hypothetical protein